MKDVKASGVKKWINAISLYERDFKKWEGRVEKILKRYRDDSRLTSGNHSAKFNILWSNVQTIVPAVFARLPKPDVSRRFRDNDPVGRVAAMILERALEFEIEHYPDYRSAMKNSVFDRFLGGRGVSWVRYEPHIGVLDDGVQITEDADDSESEEQQAEETLEYECAPVDYVHWKDFGHTQGRCWEEVTTVWRKVYMQRAALVERFGDVGEKIPLDTKPDEQKRGGYQDGDEYEACIYEIWDKPSGKAIWLSKSYPEVLDERDDPLELEGFFPCPKPLYATLTTDSLVPVPDFTLYQDQANSLDVLCDRIDGLIQALKVRGCYDAAVPELARLFTEGDNNTLIPVKNWQAFAEKQGLQGAINIVELKPIYEALNAAYQAMEQQKAQVYEITGLSDIVRGQGEASETATAQKLKGQYASLRLKSMQGDVAQFAAELLQLKAQIICKFFQPETIARIACVEQFTEADKPHVMDAIALLKNTTLSDFRIEVTADSLVQIDEAEDKQSRMELITAVSGFMEKAVPAAQASPELAPLLMELLKFGVTAFKVGKTIEGAIDETADKLRQLAAQPKQPQPDPAVQKAQIDAQTKMQLAQQDVQARGAEMQQEAQLEQQRMAIAQQHEREVADREAQQSKFEAMLNAQAETVRMNFEAFQADSDRKFQLLLQQLKDQTTLEAAQISAATTLQAAQVSAANSAAGDSNA